MPSAGSTTGACAASDSDSAVTGSGSGAGSVESSGSGPGARARRGRAREERRHRRDDLGLAGRAAATQLLLQSLHGVEGGRCLEFARELLVVRGLRVGEGVDRDVVGLRLRVAGRFRFGLRLHGGLRLRGFRLHGRLRR
ncbi:hypothetical protein GCM10025881_36210 [Pseudolysinimonas kribbensis]|uniref:Uncharacterized protein n=1 Tax=Pseudolysinimonas kribbensis TaxID=433641 RepID=A0ABQ6KEC3_9MICO|nr:hypothetical protein GCM10025881_36210 [Pseudolysinimonas kribbensis]